MIIERPAPVLQCPARQHQQRDLGLVVFCEMPHAVHMANLEILVLAARDSQCFKTDNPTSVLPNHFGQQSRNMHPGSGTVQLGGKPRSVNQVHVFTMMSDSNLLSSCLKSILQSADSSRGPSSRHLSGIDACKSPTTEFGWQHPAIQLCLQSSKMIFGKTESHGLGSITFSKN